MIRARREGLKPAQDWMTHCAAGWDFSFDKLAELINNEQREEGRHEVRRKNQR